MARTAIDRPYWRDVIRGGAATFFVGAGLSAPPPSSLPLASDLVEGLIEPVLRPLALPAVLARSISKTVVRLRPEVITDVLLEHLGIEAARPLLTALQGVPNAWHGFLGAALGTGCCVITTNFDTLIEQACVSMGVDQETVVGTAIDQGGTAKPILFKIHGSIGGSKGMDGLSSIALAVRQVGIGLSMPQMRLLRLLMEDRPLIVLGYSGRDDFDILPALLTMRRTKPGLWVIHDSKASIRALAGPGRSALNAKAAVECSRAWPGLLSVFAGETEEMMPLLRPRRGFGRLDRQSPVVKAPATESRLPDREAAAISILYALVEARAFVLGMRLFQHLERTAVSSRILIAGAVLLEKEGTDLRSAAAIAQRARTAAKNERSETRAVVLDQSGVIARRRGLYRLALRFYDQALSVAIPSKCPQWLIMQIRSHRAVALEYLGRRPEALREHRRVAEYEEHTGDLRGFAKSLNNIGIVHMNQRQWKRAIASLERSCSLKRDLGDDRGVAQSLHNLGKLHFLRGDYASAKTVFLESLRIRLGHGRDEHGAAQSFVALAHVAGESGELQQAIAYATEALELHARFGDQRGVVQARSLLKVLQR